MIRAGRKPETKTVSVVSAPAAAIPFKMCIRDRDKISCPIIFLTAKAEEQDRVNGLLSGGDDYILKPFSLKELDARIIAHLKREEPVSYTHQMCMRDRYCSAMVALDRIGRFLS